MTQERSLTRESLNLLLTWLDADEQAAAATYEKIRNRLIRLFAGRGCHEAEILADHTIDRVTFKISDLNGNYVGDPALYFYGVATKIHHEWLRRQKHVRDATVAQHAAADDGAREAEYRCLETCLEKLSPNVREMIVEYYSGEKRDKIERRKQLAHKLGISIGALQIKTSRVRSRLLECVRDCVAEK